MNKTFLLLLIAVSVAVASCGQKVDETAEAMNNLKSLAASADEVQVSQDQLEQRRQERKSKGDTLALTGDQLKSLLPNSIDGYQGSDPETSSMEIPGMSFSQVSRSYSNAKGESVKITLTDYNASEMGWAAASALFALKWKVDNSTETSGTFQTANPLVNGHATFSKQSKSATVTYGLGGRFLLIIEAQNQSNSDWAKSTAQSLDLNKLAGM